jgi:cell division protein FtsI (penicillin-binding protein 3)
MLVATVALVGAYAAIVYKSYDVQVAQAEHYRRLARRQHVRTVEVAAPRGAIYDATGFELAVSADVDSVFASPREVVDVAGTAEALTRVLPDLDVRDVEARLSSRRYFAWIDRHVAEDEAARVQAAGLPGIHLAKEPRRFYPARALAGSVLGVAGIDGEGLDGLELSMNELLSGKRARLSALRDARGKTMLTADEVTEAESLAGASIRLTLHRSIQFSTERALAEAVETHRARGGAAVVLDVRDGGVLAMASWPPYDPNHAMPRTHAARNLTVTDAYEAGSVMKVFTVAAALDAGVVEPGEVFDVQGGRFRIGRKMIRDTYRDHLLTVGGIVKRSSNVGAVKIAQRLGAERLHRALAGFGFGAETGVELPGERAGVLRRPGQWGELGLATIAYGYGVTVTPLQIATALAAIGSGGVRYEPRLVDRVTSADGRIVYERRPNGQRVLREATARALLPILASVFDKGKDGGTARSVVIDGFRAGGKTGTSYKVDPATLRYDKNRYLSSFIGLAPIEEPRIAVVVLIDEPHGEHYGGRVAGPAFGRIVGETLRTLGVVPVPAAAAAGPAERDTEGAVATAADDDRGEAPGQTLPLVEAGDGTALPGGDEGRAAAVADGRTTVPNFAGLGMRRALDLAAARGIQVEVVGSGIAVEQAPEAGAPVAETVCRIVFVPGPE